MTAENFINQWITKPLNYNDVENLMIAFAKFHVIEALKQGSKNARLATAKVLVDDTKEGDNAYIDFQVIDKNSILNGYDLNNIK